MRFANSLLILLLLVGTAQAEQFFSTKSTWYQEIPADAVVHPDSAKIVNNWARWTLAGCCIRPSETQPMWSSSGGDTEYTFETSCGPNYIDNVDELNWHKVRIPDANDQNLHNADTCVCGTYYDAWMSVYNTSYMWDFIRAAKCSGTWKTSRVHRWDRTGTGMDLTDDTYNNYTRAIQGVSSSHGVVTYDEVVNGTINHALAFAPPEGGSIHLIQSGYYNQLHPAFPYSEGGGSCTADGTYGCMKTGMRIRLKSSYDCSAHGWNQYNVKLCEAMKSYGMIVVDTSGTDHEIIVEAFPESSPRHSWSGILDEDDLPLISSTNFEIVYPICYGTDEIDACENNHGYTCGVDATCIETDVTVPTLPGDTTVAATAYDHTRINLSWTASTDNVGVTGYNVYRCAGSCTPADPDDLLDTTVNVYYYDQDLPAATTYTYNIKAYDAAGNKSGFYTKIEETTDAAPSASDYFLYKTAKTITIDGYCDEYDTQTITIGTGKYRFMWDATYLYICAESTETDVFYYSSDDDYASHWKGDSIEIFFDTANDAGATADSDDYKIDVNVSGGIYTAQGGVSGFDKTTWNPTMTQETICLGGCNINSAVGYKLEARISWAQWGISAPSIGDVWGFDMCRNDLSAFPLAVWENIDLCNTTGEGSNDPDGWCTIQFKDKPSYMVSGTGGSFVAGTGGSISVGP